MYIYKSIVYNSIITDKTRESGASWTVAVDDKVQRGTCDTYSDALDASQRALEQLQLERKEATEKLGQ